MARIARIVVPGVPHHITQRGNRRQTVFFTENDYKYYYDLLYDWSLVTDMRIWSYCFMPNHVHIIAVPSKEGLLSGIGEVNRRYTRYINFREGWKGYLWQGRFGSFPMSEAHIYSAIRYVELNPVRAGLVRKAEDWKWSSAACHIKGIENKLLYNLDFLGIDWSNYLQDIKSDVFRNHERTGRPLGDESFIIKLEKILDRTIAKQKPGPKPKSKN